MAQIIQFILNSMVRSSKRLTLITYSDIHVDYELIVDLQFKITLISALHQTIQQT